MANPDLLTAAQVAPLLGCSPQALRIIMREHPEWLPCPVVRTSPTRCRIPRVPLLQAHGLSVVRRGDDTNAG